MRVITGLPLKRRVSPTATSLMIRRDPSHRQVCNKAILLIDYLSKEREVLLYCEGVPENVVLGTESQTLPDALNVPVDVVAVDQGCSTRGGNEPCAVMMIVITVLMGAFISIFPNQSTQSAAG